MLDIAENLNVSCGFQHLLVVQSLLTDFVILCPLKTKKASEIEHVLSVAVFQQRNVEKVLSDNGPGFRSMPFLSILSALHIRVVASASLSPQGRGKIESLVKIVKLMIKRILATRPTYNWSWLPLICAIAINSTISPRTGFKPAAMVGGEDASGKSFLDLEGIAAPHYIVGNDRVKLEEMHAQIKKSTKIARERLEEILHTSHKKLNEHKINRKFEKHDYVFVLDRRITPGATRPLKTKLQPSPYIVVKPLHVTSLVKRISDGFTALYSNNDLKKFEGGSELFKDLPEEFLKILLNRFQDLLQSDFATIARYDTLELPNALPLHDLETGSPSKAPNIIDSTQNVPALGQDPDFLDFLTAQERNDINKDISAINKNAPAELSQNESAVLISDSDSEDDDEINNDWKSRLRPRNKKGRRVRFAK
jgi:hypothetical protein